MSFSLLTQGAFYCHQTSLYVSLIVVHCWTHSSLHYFAVVAAFLSCVCNCALQSLIKYISELGIPGAILIFLPGWNIIFALGRHLGQHPVIGELYILYCTSCTQLNTLWFFA